MPLPSFDATGASQLAPLPANGRFGQFSNKGDLPEGAIILTRSQVLKRLGEVIMEWRPRSEIWPFTYGLGILGSGAILSSFAMSFCFRSRLKLASSGTFGSYFPTVVLPMIGSVMAHQVTVTQPLLLREEPCIVCLQTRGMCLQAACGFALPAILSYISSIVMAKSYNSMKVPGLFDYKQLLPFISKLTKRHRPLFASLLVFNLGLGYGITTKEAMLLPLIEQKCMTALVEPDNTLQAQQRQE